MPQITASDQLPEGPEHQEGEKQGGGISGRAHEDTLYVTAFSGSEFLTGPQSLGLQSQLCLASLPRLLLPAASRCSLARAGVTAVVCLAVGKAGWQLCCC